MVELGKKHQIKRIYDYSSKSLTLIFEKHINEKSNH